MNLNLKKLKTEIEKDNLIFLYLLVGYLSYKDSQLLKKDLSEVNLSINLDTDKVLCKKALWENGKEKSNGGNGSNRGGNNNSKENGESSKIEIKLIKDEEESKRKQEQSQQQENEKKREEYRYINVEEFLRIMLECWIKKAFCFKELDNDTNSQGGNS